MSTMADYDSRFNKIDQDLSLIKAEITILKWMLGFLVAGMVSLLLKSLLLFNFAGASGLCANILKTNFIFIPHD